jgi:MFS family permease
MSRAEREPIFQAVRVSQNRSMTTRRQASAGLALIGSGRFQLLAAVVLGLANCSDSVELLAVSFILPNIDASKEQRAFMTAGSFVGMLFGGFGAGLIADTYGRRVTLYYSLLINALFGLLSAASPNATTLAVLRLLAGVGVGESHCITCCLSMLCSACYLLHVGD